MHEAVGCHVGSYAVRYVVGVVPAGAWSDKNASFEMSAAGWYGRR